MKSPAKLARKVFSAALSAALVFSMSPVLGGVAHADDAGGASPGANLTTIMVSATFHQDEARQMLGDINSFRTKDPVQQRDTSNVWQKLGPQPQLEYDYVLEQAAMKRAVEISQSFDHVRPNGQYFSSLHATMGTHGENIAYGMGMDRARAMEVWKEDKQLYNGQGHRRNMLNSTYRYVAIAHATVGNYEYWVQEFASSLSNNGSTFTNADTSTRDVEVTVPVSRDVVTGVSRITWAGGYSADVFAGESVQFSANVEPKTALNKAVIWKAERTDTLGGDDVLTIDSNGLCMTDPSYAAVYPKEYAVTVASVENPSFVSDPVLVHVKPRNQAPAYLKFHTITYKSNKVNVDDLSILVREGWTPSYPLLSATDGSRFVGWCTDSALNNYWNATSVTEDLTLYAKWENSSTPTDPEKEARETARTKLTAAINRASAISNNNGDYTSESFGTLTDAISEAERVAGDSSSTREQLDNARAIIENAEKGLVKIDRELEKARSDLQTAIAEAERVTNSNPDDSEANNSFEALKQAINDATAALNGSSATTSSLDSAKAALEAARRNFDAATTAAEERKAALTKARNDLKDALAGVAELSNEGGVYTATSFASFEDARTKAQGVLGTAATKEELEKALADLNAAEKGLEVIDKDAAELQAARQALACSIAEAKEISNSNNDYTPESFQKLAAAIASAEALLNNPAATKDQVEAETSALASARSGLVKIDKEAEARKAARADLQKAIDNAASISGDGYTIESFQRLQEALAAGRALLGNDSASKASLDAATKSIADARAALKEASKDPDPAKPDPEPNPDPTPGPDPVRPDPEPARPDRPVTPVTPDDPGEPATPANPDPAKPEEPAKPDENAKPDPGKPEQTDKPAKPTSSKASVVGTKAAIERYTTFKPRAPKISTNSIQASWTPVVGAARYVVYMTPCGKGNKYKKVATLTKPTYTLKGLKKGTYYRYYVKALDKDGKSLGKSMVSHVLTEGGKGGNPEGIKLTKSASRGKLSLKKGDSKRVVAKAKKGSDGLRHHGEMLRFASSDTDVATVTPKGKVKAVGKGKATIWIFTANCKVAKVKVAVK